MPLGVGSIMADIIVDNVIEERETGAVSLWLRQSDPWDTPDVMTKLHTRLNEYVYLVREGLFLKQFPKYQNKPVKITIVCYQEPPEEAKLFLDRANHKLNELRLGFGILVIQVGTPHNRIKESIERFINKLRGESPPPETLK